jgi:hypothetical protein
METGTGTTTGFVDFFGVSFPFDIPDGDAQERFIQKIVRNRPAEAVLPSMI